MRKPGGIFRRGFPYRACLLAAAVAAALALPVPDFGWGHDGPIHAANLLSVESSLRAGRLLPRWTDGYNGGYGGPNLKYYSFFAYYPGAVLKIATGMSAVAALGWSLRVAAAVGFLGAARLASGFFGRKWAFLGGALYALYPYHLVLIFTRLALPECFAYDLAPWALWATWRAAAGRGAGAFGAAAIGWAALLLVHNLALILWFPTLAVWMLVSAWAIGKRPRPLRTAALALAALLLSAFQFFPSLFELSWTSAGRELADRELYRNAGLPVWSLLSYPAVDALSAKLAPGPVHLVLLCGAVAWGGYRCRRRRAARRARLCLASGALGVAALVLSTRASYLLASVVTPLVYIQFPWRYLGVAGAFLTLAGVGCARWCARRVPAALVTGFFVAQIFLLDRPYFSTGPNRFPVRSLEDLRGAVFTGDYENKYLPLGARLPSHPLRAAWESSGEVEPKSERVEPGRLLLDFSSRGPVEIRALRYFFPGWRAELDGSPVALERDPLDGAMLLRVEGRGRHRLIVERRWTVLERLYAVLSVIAAGSLLARSRRARQAAGAALSAIFASIVVVGLTSSEGFRPRGSLLAGMLSDRVGHPGGGGWRLRRYADSYFGRELEPIAVAALNLGPGLRPGFQSGVWAASLRVPEGPGWEVALERSGDVALALDGKRVVGRTDSAGAEDALSLHAPLRLEPAPRGAAGVRIAVLARWDSDSEGTTRARLLWRPAGARGFWRLVPPEVLTPVENAGPEEYFRAR
ncbi:MAG: hypothetical protein ACUVYA_01255 [Planctomycetota bacterium]